MKRRVTLYEADTAREPEYRAINPSTGEVLECASAATLLAQISRSLATQHPSERYWTIERTR